MNSNKLISNKLDGPDEPMRDFKKNRNLSTNSSNGSNQVPINININPNIGFMPPQQIVNPPPILQMNNSSPNTLAPNSKPIYI